MDRTQRYETANGLAMDLKRYLAFEPVIARPPSTRDRVTKFVRRHRVGVAVTAAAALLVVAATLGLALLAQRLARERDRAEREAARASSIATFLQDTLSSADPWSGGARDVSVADALAAATAKIDRSFQKPAAGRRRCPSHDRVDICGAGASSTKPSRWLVQRSKHRGACLGSVHEEVAETLTVLAERAFVKKGQYEQAEA